jgi:hypothetical protein
MAPDARFVDVTYRGLRVATRARLTESSPGVGFVEVEAPLPVGTTLKLAGDTTADARVTGVVEQEAGAKSPPGMRIVWGEKAAPARPAAEAVAEAVKPAAVSVAEAVTLTDVRVPASVAAAAAESPSESESASESESDSESAAAAADSVSPAASDTSPPGEPGRRRRRRKPGRS